MTGGKILQEGRNCWRIARARKAAFLIDAANYFSALKIALERARHSILILAWDIDSRLRLVRDASANSAPNSLIEILNALVSNRKDLHVYILAWDFAMIYAPEREWLPIYKLGWRTHHRVEFRMDGSHPAGASHHQKVVVVDDTLAFAGGIDPCRARWDTSEHRADEPRRVDPGGESYPPFHDVQMAVEGEAAAVLGELARTRWARATGRQISPPASTASHAWPEDLKPDLEGIDLAVSLTQPQYGDAAEIRQIERLYLDAIRNARQSVYIENQYLTSNTVGEALAQRLSEPDGPEVVLVLPRKTSGWLEQNTMDVLRHRLLKKIRNADLHGRLGVYYPDIPALGGACLNVHAKVLVVDDALVRVGSSNLSNRSMGLDTECDLSIEADGHPNIRRQISRFRNRLLAEHLGVDPKTVTQRLESDGSLIAAIEALRTNPRTLNHLDEQVPEGIDRAIPDSAAIDPERPIDPERLIELFIPDDQLRQATGMWLRFGLTLSALALLLALWLWTPLAEWLNIQHLGNWIELARMNWLGPVAVIGLFLVGSLIAVPISLLMVGTLLVFGPIEGFAYAWTGCLLGAGAGYELGRIMGRDLVRRYGGRRINRLSQWLARRGVMTVATLRIVPVAPFAVINVVAGASHIRFSDYLIGTTLGLTPGLLAVTAGIDQLIRAAREPGLFTFAVLAAVLIIIGCGVWLVRRWSLKQEGKANPVDMARSRQWE